MMNIACTIASKINDTPKGVYINKHHGYYLDKYINKHHGYY